MSFSTPPTSNSKVSSISLSLFGQISRSDDHQHTQLFGLVVNILSIVVEFPDTILEDTV